MKGDWSLFQLAVRRARRGYEAKYLLARAKFSAMWSNPMWEWLQYNVSSQYDEVSKMIDAFVRHRLENSKQ